MPGAHLNRYAHAHIQVPRACELLLLGMRPHVVHVVFDRLPWAYLRLVHLLGCSMTPEMAALRKRLEDRGVISPSKPEPVETCTRVQVPPIVSAEEIKRRQAAAAFFAAREPRPYKPPPQPKPANTAEHLRYLIVRRGASPDQLVVEFLDCSSKGDEA